MIGPGKAFDTDRYFVICSNVLGGCQGTTGPASINPPTGRPYAMSFPVFTIRDMVRLQKMLIDSLGIEKLLCVAGGSMGGMQALEWAVSYPDVVRCVIPIATTWRHSAQQIAFNEVGRQAIMADPDWGEGDYYDRKPPSRGLSVARMIGHITYMSDESMREKFGRKLREKEKFGFDFGVDFEVESYLRYRGNQFVSRFDANSYLYITKAEDYFDLTNGTGKLNETFRKVDTRFLVISFTSTGSTRAISRRRSCACCGASTVMWRTAICSRTTGMMRFWWILPNRAKSCAASSTARQEWRGRHRIRQARKWGPPYRISATCHAHGTGDFHVIGEIVEPGSRVLDLGCGEGELLAWLHENKNVTARGVRSPPRRCGARSGEGFRCFRETSMKAWPTTPTKPSTM